MDNRYIGILVNQSTYRHIPTGDDRHESLACYEVAAKQHGVRLCYFRLKDLKPGQPSVQAYVHTPRGYVKRLVPTPEVIHNRGLYFQPSAKIQLERLAASGTQIFNLCTRYSKKRIHDLLAQDPDLLRHLPVTFPATVPNIWRMMTLFDTLIIKPNNSSVGRGIMKLRKDTGKDRWILDYPVSKASRTRKLRTFAEKLPSVLVNRIQATSFIVQQCWPLATYRSRPFDMRVSVQRNETGNWNISGIAVKVAKANVFLTNIAQGGKVYSLDDVLAEYPELDASTVRERVAQLSLRVAERLSLHLPHLADIGLDVGIDCRGNPLFIECNGRDLRICFQEGDQLEEFQQTYSNPIGYAKYLLHNRREMRLGYGIPFS